MCFKTLIINKKELALCIMNINMFLKQMKINWPAKHKTVRW